MRAFAVTVLVLFVAACATQAERAAQVQRDVDDMIKVYGPGCEKLGFKPDSDPWRISALRRSHPYEEPAFDVYPLVSVT